MHASEPRQLFQIIGLTACAVVGLPVLVDFAFQLPAELAKNPLIATAWQRQAPFVLVMALPVLFVLTFALVF
jgi:hypothetical protein